MKIKLIALLVITQLITSSCEDGLDTSPETSLTSENAFNTTSDIEAALVGTYESFQSAEYYVWDFLLFGDVRSDNGYAGGDNPEIFQIDLLNIENTNSRLFRNWSNIYNAISKANVVIERTPLVNDITLTEERRNQIIGEALFLRAYHHFTLVKTYGEIPIVTSTIQSLDPSDIEIPRSSIEQVYNQILQDLDDAIELLPETFNSQGSIKARATSGAAHALAAKVNAQSPNRDYEEVLRHIEAVESSSANYQLIEYARLFDGLNENNEESIMEIQYTGSDEGNFGPQLLLPFSISGDRWRKFATPSVDLINAYDALGDTVRREASILFESAPWVDEYWGNSFESIIPFGFKWKNADGFASANNTYLIRYGDIVLLKAEALNEVDNLNLAVVEVNRIRRRANLPELTAEEQSSKEVLKTVILNERRLELAFEGHRWDDLSRNGVLISTMNDLREIDLRTGNAVNYNMTEEKRFAPIPREEFDRNSAL